MRLKIFINLLKNLQNRKEGIIDYLISQLNIDKIKFIKIGVGDCSEKNIRFFFDWISSKKMIIDYIKNFREMVQKKPMYQKTFGDN
jgi:hypothetical protein|tara:strand:+ start:232 stop:489 length:258 start_codon:yes stop_codon:yes gene_type:complete